VCYADPLFSDRIGARFKSLSRWLDYPIDLSDAKERFSSRAAYYARYRPRYPVSILEFMEEDLNLSSQSVIADVGSGTGILSELFLKHGNPVLGVEPNEHMRKMAEGILTKYPRFRSVNGSAEATTLPSHTVDFVTAAQSFHWFNPPKAREEFLRILKPRGWVTLIWNTRRKSTPFMQVYDRLVNDYTNDSRRVRHEDIGEESIGSFLGPHRTKIFSNQQLLDLAALKGRLLSSSYAPLPGDQRNRPMLVELRRLFDTYQRDGLVRMEYDTEVYSGQLMN
jgi:SAM-dependent methyltransferase